MAEPETLGDATLRIRCCHRCWVTSVVRGAATLPILMTPPVPPPWVPVPGRLFRSALIWLWPVWAKKPGPLPVGRPITIPSLSFCPTRRCWDLTAGPLALIFTVTAPVFTVAEFRTAPKCWMPLKTRKMVIMTPATPSLPSPVHPCCQRPMPATPAVPERRSPCPGCVLALSGSQWPIRPAPAPKNRSSPPPTAR